MDEGGSGLRGCSPWRGLSSDVTPSPQGLRVGKFRGLKADLRLRQWQSWVPGCEVVKGMTESPEAAGNPGTGSQGKEQTHVLDLNDEHRVVGTAEVVNVLGPKAHEEETGPHQGP